MVYSEARADEAAAQSMIDSVKESKAYHIKGRPGGKFSTHHERIGTIGIVKDKIFDLLERSSRSYALCHDYGRAEKTAKKALALMKDSSFQTAYASQSPRITRRLQRSIDDYHERRKNEIVANYGRLTVGRRFPQVLESKAAAASIIGIVGGLFFLSPNLTGNAIGPVALSDSNGLGVILIIIGLIGTYFWIKK